MTLAQIIELITTAIGRITFTAAGAPATSGSGSSEGILKGVAYALAVVTPSSASFNPLIFFCVLIAFVGFGLGLIKRIIKL